MPCSNLEIFAKLMYFSWCIFLSRIFTLYSIDIVAACTISCWSFKAAQRSKDKSQLPIYKMPGTSLSKIVLDLLIWKVDGRNKRGRERRDRDLPSIESLPSWPQQSGLFQAEARARSFFWVIHKCGRSLSTWSSVAFPRPLARKGSGAVRTWTRPTWYTGVTCNSFLSVNTTMPDLVVIF